MILHAEKASEGKIPDQLSSLNKPAPEPSGITSQMLKKTKEDLKSDMSGHPVILYPISALFLHFT
jgi:hypothetical protein